jgi:flagellar biosynthesis protein FlhF
MRQIREELGPDALILHTKSVEPWGPMRLVRGGGVEILAAVDQVDGADEPAPERTAPVELRASAATLAAAAPAAPAARRPAAPIAAPADGLHAEVATLKNLLVQFGGGRLLPPALGPYYERLVAGGVEPALALRLLHEVAAVAEGDGEPGPTERCVGDALARMLRVAAPAAGAARVALVGPAGAGKTVTAAKLAARAQMSRGGTAILNLDGNGFTSPGPLETLAAILDVSYAAAVSADDLARATGQAPLGGTLVIDTPAVGVADEAGLARLVHLLAAASPDEVHLVLPATMKTADALAAVRAFSAAGVTHLLFTRLDETTSCGSVLSVGIETGLPLSYLGTGREIPGDLVAADPAHIVHRALEPRSVTT